MERNESNNSAAGRRMSTNPDAANIKNAVNTTNTLVEKKAGNTNTSPSIIQIKASGVTFGIKQQQQQQMTGGTQNSQCSLAENNTAELMKVKQQQEQQL